MSAPEAKVDDLALSRRLVTPEGVDLRLGLASAAERASAFVIDAGVILVALLALTLIAAPLGLSAGEAGREVAAIVWLLGAFALRNGYFMLFELGPRGATPGKQALRLRVVARDGGAPTAEAIFARNALREIEIFLPLSLIGGAMAAGDPVDGAMVGLALVWSGTFLLLPLFNRERLRAGDLVAGTWVVRSPRPVLLADLAAASSSPVAAGVGGFAFTTAQTGAYGVKELELLEPVLRRRDPEALAAVARRIRAKIGYAAPLGENDEAFLTAYYAALRGRLEQGLLFGRRRRDKFDVG